MRSRVCACTLPVATHGNSEALGQLAEELVAAPVVAPVGALELDAQAVGAEDPQQAPGGRGGARVVTRLDARGHRAVARATRQADEPLGAAFDVGERHARLLVERVLARAPAVGDLSRGIRPALAGPAARVPVRGCDQPAEVRVALARLAQQGQVSAVVERELGARDRPHPERLERLRHLHGAVQPIVVCQGKGLVALIRRRPGQLHRMRRAVKERVGRVAVELDVRHEHMFAYVPANYCWGSLGTASAPGRAAADSSRRRFA